ncbi:hypothetical protein, conserved [Babesia ovata]|uniref:Extracellular matrix-binding ebh n=1 Tax=Babesia ovata TaxID=189622 RepID=A0A2H6K8A6_9APIC|nr:uncharacterized protein BOVATA_007010 [Babesia ovata]GBE59208.1 hypothetical protein, conserved [Babesia ovata]
MKSDIKVSDIIQEITRSIEDDLSIFQSGQSHSHQDGELQNAVEGILHQLVGRAQGAAAKIQKLLSDGNFGYADTALRLANELTTNLNTALGMDEFGLPIHDGIGYAQAVDTAINDVSGELTTQIGKDDTTKTITTLATGSDNFQGYRAFVDQDERKLEALLSGKVNVNDDGPEQNKLPKAIKQIETTVNGKGHLEEVVNEKDGNNPNTFDSKTFEVLCNKVNSKLQILCDEVKGLLENSEKENDHPGDKRGALRLLDDLYSMLNDGKREKSYQLKMHLREIYEEIRTKIIGTSGDYSGIPETLLQIKTAAEKFHNETIPNTVNACISYITDKIQKEVTEKIRNLKTTALHKFATTKQKELEDLKKLVTEKNSEIQKIIGTDLASGTKGLLRLVSGNLTTYIDPLRYPNVSEMSRQLKWYLDPLLDYIRLQVRTPAEAPGKEPQPSEESKKVGSVRLSMDDLLKYLSDKNVKPDRNGTRIYTFDHHSDKLRTSLTAAVTNLTSPNFHGFHNPLLLDALKAGMTQFTEQLSHAYVNKYSGMTFGPLTEQKPGATPTTDKALSTEGRNCAKVCLTIMEGLRKDVFDLRNECGKASGGWGEMNINLSNKLGPWFSNRGYRVSKEKQDGELRSNDANFKGKQINENLLNKNIDGASGIEILKTWKQDKNKSDQKNYPDANEISLYDMVEFLREFFRKFYEACQLEHHSSPKSPSNIYQMMQWLSGLYFNPMLKKLDDQFNGLFGEANQLDIAVPDKRHYTINSPLNSAQLSKTLEQVCLLSQLTLVAIQGHGHAEGRYACDFRTNIDKLNYPSNPYACFDMLVDILHRVFYQLRFLHSQCSNSRRRGGWADCHYGRYVGGSSWDCNDKQCGNLECNLSPNQNTKLIANQLGDQTCKQHPNCGLKSPLQSFLEDGLKGFLPHYFKTPGCKLTCTISNHRGVPCLTPMGFTDICVAASHTKTGDHLRAKLDNLCGGAGKSLTKMCSMLGCLLRVAPQTLGDMLAFYYQLLHNWNNNAQHRKDAFVAAVKKANFWDEKTTLEVASIQQSTRHDHNDKHHDKGDLFSLTDCVPKFKSGLPCGRYLHPITLYIRSVFSEKHADNYLSWVVYITEAFLGLLYDLYESCKICETPGTRCCDRSCATDCKVKYADATGTSKIASTGDKHNEGCKSIVQCPDMYPTLYKYGFIFGSPHKLSGEDKNAPQHKRTCKDFCQALKYVIGENCVLVQLIHDIDKFIWEIRQNFSYTLLTLWSLSLLYLLHILVVRLDVLRIRSHLKSPSSHRIAAQSLLAAARVDGMGRKALTNCPENLREAIDWLIQVKHGGGIPRLSSALGKLFDHVAQDAQTSLSSLSESDEPAARDVISKLQGFRSSLPKNPENNNQNILHNLCSSLETFLGYRSPGTYDGSGIVYGDASRLCDAVLSFLHGVFSDIRDNQPYVVGRALLGNVVGELEKARWTGHHGFSAVLPKVASGLGDYNRKVKASNDRVKRPIDVFLTYVKEGGELCNGINDLQVSNVTGDLQNEDPRVVSADALVSQCLQKAEAFNVAMNVNSRDGVMKKAINDLNSSLRERVHRVRKSVRREKMRLQKLSRKELDNYLAFMKMIRKLELAKRKIIKEVEVQVTDLVEKLKKMVREILEKLQKINDSLEQYVDKLGKWIEATKEFIEEVKNGDVQRIVDETTDNVTGMTYLFDKDATDVVKWKEELERLIKHEKEQIKNTVEKAKNEKVKQLDTWKQAAEKVLENVIKSGNEVHDELDPAKTDGDSGKNKIGKKLGEIDTAKNKISEANESLGKQVTNLENWITSAEKTRKAAEDKANEASNLLKEYKDGKREETELTKNIKRIEYANKNIVKVHEGLKNADKDLAAWKGAADALLSGVISQSRTVREKLTPTKDSGYDIGTNIHKITEAQKGIVAANTQLGSHLGNLSDWKGEAEKVIGDAVSKAEKVYKALDVENTGKGEMLSLRIDVIDKAKNDIDTANKGLQAEVTALSDWKSAADKIVAAGKVKCEKILEKVVNKSNDVKHSDIYKEADALQQKATALLTAYKDAYSKVDNLKRQVPAAIDQLEEGMKTDLGNIRDSIVSKMKEHVGEMLKDIKKSVEQIKGTDRSSWQNPVPSGLLGIAQGVQQYAQAFSEDRFAEIAKGWLEATILRYNGTVRRILGKKDVYDGTKKEGDIEAFAIGMKEKLKTDVIGIAKEAFEGVNTVSGSIHTNITAVKTACNEFANGLDKKLLQPVNEIVSEVKEKALNVGGLVAKIKNCICECDNCNKPNCAKKAAAELIMCALTSTVRQVGNELESVLLGVGTGMGNNADGTKKSIADLLDKAKKATEELHENLGAAEKEANKKDGQPSAPSNGNTILEKVNDIEKQVKEGMKISKDVNTDFEKIMDKYHAAKGDTASGDHKYHNLLHTDIPGAMNAFKSMGAFTDEERPQNEDVSKANEAVSKHLFTVEEELKEIAHHVDNTKGKLQPPPTDKFGITQRLEDLERMLGNGNEYKLKSKLDGLADQKVKGLDAIRQAIQTLKTDTYEQKSSDIGGGVTQIKAQLEELRKQLKKDGQNDKTAVVNALNDLQKEGLNTKGKWQATKSGNPVDGLMKIHGDIDNLKKQDFTQNPTNINDAVQQITQELQGLQQNLEQQVTTRLETLQSKGLNTQDKWDDSQKAKGFENIKSEISGQNKTLKEQSDYIETALNKIRWVLSVLGFKLNDNDAYDDITDQLKRLAKHLGTGTGIYKNNLQAIHGVISGLQKGLFTQKPDEIGKTNEAIKGELQKQRNALKSDVTEKLMKLKDHGLNKGGNNWTGDTKDVSGLAKIEDEIDTALTGISDYADAINIDHITSGLQKVSDNIEDHVGILTYHVKETTEAVQRKLQQFLSERLFEKLGATEPKETALQEIHDELHRLRTRDLHSVIKSLAAFDEYADRLRNETIRELTAFVSRELDAVAAELTQHARRHYVSNVQSALTFFAKTVAGELTGLPRAIESDLEIGFKGFVSQAEGKGGKNINLLADEKSATSVRDLSYMFGVFFGRLMLYVAAEIKRVHEEEYAKKNPSLPKATDHYADRLNDVHAALTALLSHLTQHQRYDHEVPGLLDDLTKALAGLRPECFARPNSPVIDGVVDGLTAFAAELRNVYISVYDGQTFECVLVRSEAVTEANKTLGAIAVTVENVGHLTPYGKKCAKVLLTIITIIHDAIAHLVDSCERDWRNHRITLQTHDQKDNPLGSCLHNCGYRVADDDAAQTAELRNDCAGTDISQLLKAPVSGADEDRHLQQCASNAKRKTSDFHVIDIINCLIQHLNEYYVCCHLNVPQSPKPPCSVYEMLVWLSGLRHSRAYDALKRHVRAAVETEDAQSGETKPYTLAAPTAFSAGNMLFLLDHMTSQSYYLLVCILGTGDAHTVYAADFPNNSCKLQYPTDGEECFHLLLDILRRLFPPLKFLSARCGLGARHHGWAQCKYGKNVTPYTWQCNRPLKNMPNRHPECTDKSPLMSYLNDCLPGHLPHQVSNVGCEPQCNTCPSRPNGTPCLTPLGFRGFSGSTKTGKQLCKVLTKFLCNDHVTCIFTLLPRPPSSLPEHFGFALSLAAGINTRIPDRRSSHKTLADAFDASTDSLSLGLYKTGALVAALTHAYGAGSVDHADCQHHHLKHLATHNFCTGKSRNMDSAAYLSSLCHDAYNHLAHRHSDLYLSWAVYLPWQLWQHLERLHGALCSISCHDWGCFTCLHGDTCVPGRHGLCDDMTESPRCHCTSVVQCSGVSPTLYNYGFTFPNPSALNREDSPNTCAQLSKLLTNVLHSRHFTNLFHHCDQFLWEIRTPFLYTLVAIWLIATLYILVILLYRIDVLHVRSHLLTTRASHLIDVKALLAGSRRMLSLYKDVDYFDDDFHS